MRIRNPGWKKFGSGMEKNGSVINIPDTDGMLARLLIMMLIFRSELTEVKMQQLQMIRGSPSYADRLADNISQKLRLVQKVSVHTAVYVMCLLQLCKFFNIHWIVANLIHLPLGSGTTYSFFVSLGWQVNI
jgi:hypothetical protein